MQAFSFHSPGKSRLHRAHPITKLLLVAFCITTSFVTPWPFLWPLTLALLAAGAVSGIGRLVAGRYIVLSLPFTFAVFAFHGLIMPRPDFRPLVSWLAYSPAGIEHAAIIGGRISVMLAASMLFVATTHPAALLRAFDAARWPPALSFLLASPLLLLDQFAARTRAIREAQQARGLEIGGSLVARIRALHILLVPLLTLALSDAQERAHVLTARGFRALPYRTVIHPPDDSAPERLLRIALTGAMILEIVYVILR
ncbi:energy-coupling factor transporter transmembrane component T family protein [Shinella sp. BYT-45]|uniref:energy-coupling factor transporter transmembrane component T family protein n=1 Tax=Shinella sp. BYT-45 TaxID=3377377 RepID=UPI00397F489F